MKTLKISINLMLDSVYGPPTDVWVEIYADEFSQQSETSVKADGIWIDFRMFKIVRIHSEPSNKRN